MIKQSRISTSTRFCQKQESLLEPESLNMEGCTSLLGKAQIVKVMRVASDEVDVHLYRASANNCARKCHVIISRNILCFMLKAVLTKLVTWKKIKK